MTFSKANISRMATEMKRAAGALLEPQQVDLYQGDTARVRMHVAVRRAGESNVTAGATAEHGLIATIDADHWDAQAGRAPQKGDRVHWAEKRYAVRDVHIAAPAGVTVFYKCELDG